ncbi:N-6 DNA Methylase [Flexibacter flexilis DSM 6793]|uniref:site-specific DNA-methyltransferase (adenine-specific) n=1 Tax=Flexibacter flexilis DSM 6793 TaxID=927664 RepID=A0A1I1P041_9BACT|nr:DNA methyltransferase [Flexibacter flexilis]SFD03291.1 N-6 DNA Methylase [Flexibacter flexilis DSM 6793]
MALSWNEIKTRAVEFSKEWANTSNEEADAKPFLDAFFNVFGITRKKIGTFEHRVKKLDDASGYIDLLWKGVILIEMKSRGKNLDKAYQQAIQYTHGLKQHELPKYILISDFEIFRLYDLEEDKTLEFQISELVNNVQHFGYLLGYQKKEYKEQDPANIKAAELMGKLHDSLKEIGYDGHPLEVYLVRILFVLFAEDTTIFNKQQFQEYIEQRTNEDGSDLAAKLQELFQVLNTPKEKRFKNLDEQLADFPYVNGKLFEEILPTASFDSKMRRALLECCYIDWSKISPAIFGSMFQSVMNPVERRNLGAHYTSEANILKLIKPLFLDELWAEFHAVKDNKNKLAEFHKKLSTLKFLDPACGCGNFLVITYRELRLLELEILRTQYKNQMATQIQDIIWLDVDQFCGIEYEEFPAQIAQVALWLIDHQMNMRISNEFGQYFARLPLKKSAKIIHGNALRTDWESVVSKNELSYIIGNPPFLGKKEQNANQKSDMEFVFSGIKGSGILDYVTAWYIKAAQFIQKTDIKVAFVSTNSISQGEQVGILWQILFNKYHIKIHFAHQTFSWSNEAKGNAAVHVIIVGFANFDSKNEKRIFEYENIKGEPHEIKAKNINPFLVEGKDITVENRKSPISKVSEIIYGSFALDDGNYTLSEEERKEIISENKSSEKLIKPFIGGRELLHSEKRYCLWLAEAEPSDIKGNSKIKERVEAVKKWRSNSDRANTKKLAYTPTLFAEVRQPKTNYLAFPTVSSVNRKYIPIAFLSPNIIASNQLYVLPNATLFHFGILTSIMHMSWVKYICGRLKSDYRYSASIVYNNYPWPQNPTDKQIKAIEAAAQKVLDVRASFQLPSDGGLSAERGGSSLADLYDPLTMPPDLVKAHQNLDKAVDLAYRSQPFTTEANRMEFLFGLYEQYTADLFFVAKPKRKRS